jgi:iron complex transport system ATP-binding protein
LALTLRDLSFQRGQRAVLGPLSVELRAGEMVGVVGPNGSGKSTLLRLLYGYLAPSQGSIHLDDRRLEQIDPRRLAQLMGACPQEGEPSLDFTVEQALALAAGGDLSLTVQRMGRFPFLGLQTLKGRLLSQLSGGEKQRIRLGRALLAEPPWLVLDEPANHLDLATGWSLLSYLAAPRSGGVVVALHDLANACRFCHRLMVLDQGKLVAFAPPAQALTQQTLDQVFGLQAEVRVSDGQSLLEIRGVTVG